MDDTPEIVGELNSRRAAIRYNPRRDRRGVGANTIRLDLQSCHLAKLSSADDSHSFFPRNEPCSMCLSVKSHCFVVWRSEHKINFNPLGRTGRVRRGWAILAIETEANRLAKMKTFTETAKTSSEKVLEEIRKMTNGLDRQIQTLREAVDGLKQSSAQSKSKYKSLRLGSVKDFV
jgi:hypothetical protein